MEDIHTSMIMNSCVTLSQNAVVVTKLKAGLIAGIDFMKENQVVIDIPNSALILPDIHIVSFNSVLRNPNIQYSAPC